MRNKKFKNRGRSYTAGSRPKKKLFFWVEYGDNYGNPLGYGNYYKSYTKQGAIRQAKRKGKYISSAYRVHSSEVEHWF